MADIGHEVAPHLPGLFQMGDVLEGDQNARLAVQIDPAAGDAKGGVLTAVVGQKAGQARFAVAERGLDLLIIDYIQLVTGSSRRSAAASYRRWFPAVRAGLGNSPFSS